MSASAPTVGQVAVILDGLRAKNGGQARAIGRKLIRGLRDSFPGRSFSPPTSESIRAFEEAADRFAKLDRAEDKVRRLEREIESVRAETVRLRRGRCERVIDDAIRRGVAQKSERDDLVRALEADDVGAWSRLDPHWRPPAGMVEEFERAFGLEPSPDPPKTAEEAERVALAAVFGLSPEELT